MGYVVSANAARRVCEHPSTSVSRRVGMCFAWVIDDAVLKDYLIRYISVITVVF